MAVVGGAGGGQGPPPNPQGSGVPANLQYAGIAVGLILLCGGIGSMFLGDRFYGVSVLLVCVGFGITLAVFGAGAAGTILNFTVVGGGATAIVLYLLLYSYPILPFESYVKGKIEHTDKLISVTGEARQSFFVGRPNQNTDYQFVIFEGEIASPQLYFYFLFPDGSKTKEFYIGCIDSKLFSKDLGGDKDIILALEPVGAEGEFKLIDNDTGDTVGRFNQKRCSSEPKTDQVPAHEVSFDFLSMEAYAMDEAQVVQDALGQLDSEDPAQRDDARTQLALLDQPQSYQAIAQSWNIQQSSYRQDLGRLVAWSSAIERDRKTAVYIADSLAPEQLAYLAQMTGQGDFTLRQYATEVLHRLLETTSWPAGPMPDKVQAIVNAVTDVLRNPKLAVAEKPDQALSLDNRLYNTLVAIGFAECNINAGSRNQIVVALDGLAEQLAGADDAQKTLAKLQNVESGLKACPA
jgi:hypothetical protein